MMEGVRNVRQNVKSRRVAVKAELASGDDLILEHS